MPSLRLQSIVAVATLATSALAGDKSYPFAKIPHTTHPRQDGYNDCGTGASQDSNCQTIHFNSLDDFCLWAPQKPSSDVAAEEEKVVAWCTAEGHGSRVMPAGTITGAHFVKTSKYIQITGRLDGPKINIAKGNLGGELDPHGATGDGNPLGGLVYTTAFGKGVQQIKEWMTFMSDGQFCMRACNPTDPNADLQCQHIYDTMGCDWVIPGDYSASFDSCEADPIEPPGIYGTSTYARNGPNTPAAHAPAETSKCQKAETIAPAIAAPSAASPAAGNSSAGASTGRNSTTGSSGRNSSAGADRPAHHSSSNTHAIVSASSSAPAATAATGSTSGAETIRGAAGSFLGLVGFAAGLLA